MSREQRNTTIKPMPQHEEQQSGQNDQQPKTPDWDYSYAQSEGGNDSQNPYAQTPDRHGSDMYWANERMRHSLWGIASFVIALLAIMGLFAGMAISTNVIMELMLSNPEMRDLMELAHTDPEQFEKSQEEMHELSARIFVGNQPPVALMYAGFMIIGCMFLLTIAFAFGIVGLCQANTRKGFAISGIILSLAPILFFVGTAVLGLAMGQNV